jgi:hypothetical protein
MPNNNAKGSALIEFLPVSGLLAFFVAVALTGAYLIFGKAWIQYQSEQALYCAAEKSAAIDCQSELDARLRPFLPWGTTEVRIRSADELWTVEVIWKFGPLTLDIVKELTPRQLLAQKVLHW